MTTGIVVGMPLYRSIPATFFTHWLTMDKTPVRATVSVQGVYLTHAMTKLVNLALEHDGWDKLVILESDVIPPLGAFNRVAEYQADKHVVGPVMFQHVPPYTAMVFGPDPDPAGTVKPFGPDIIKQIVENPALYACSAVSFGFTTIHRTLLENWDKSVPMFQHSNDVSHDVYFATEAKKQGFGVYVDSSLVCDHLSEIPVSYPQNQAFSAIYGEQVPLETAMRLERPATPADSVLVTWEEKDAAD